VGALCTAFSAGVDVGEIRGEGARERQFPGNTAGVATITGICAGLLALTSFPRRREEYRQELESKG
jgi:hypothetical protein